ncbi:hypothetical protein CMQ_3430 [Grosmannia clavigera kw1407]|uniref:Uncharacterized protein n=1 Tax=Grosmannia clavigera (strain kw1407 / UAMH 11150) TaxID=655863 RepID=F0X8F3_GROCL|nr:uncharacterized protein CMQ_3430 [Grosmannia clavigera kw1407]EFX05361.1 hypothetical protein CMQ_3430 [Grosmannia clavigera kw1407]
MGNVVLSPALPSELLHYIISCCAHPTTLIVCSSQDDFVAAFLGEGPLDQQQRAREQRSRLVQAPSSLLQVAVSRHIRVAFVPTVVHLRAFLAAFDPRASRIGPPPELESSSSSSSSSKKDAAPPVVRPSLFAYGFVQLHRDSSEWSAQGLATSAAVLVETAGRAGFDALLVDIRSSHDLDERVPILSTVPRRQLQKAGYPLRTERLRAVLGRWFRFAPGAWDGDDSRDGDGPSAEAKQVSDSGGRPPERQQIAPRDYVRDSEDDESSLGDASEEFTADDAVSAL